MKFDVIFYDLPNGVKPAEEFILSLDKKMRAKVLREITLLAANGYELREPDSKSLGDGIFELRAKVGTDISRVLYFFFVGHTNERIYQKDPAHASIRKSGGSAVSRRISQQGGE